MSLGLCPACQHQHLLVKGGLCWGCSQHERSPEKVVLQNMHDLTARLREFVASLGIDGTVYHTEPSESGKSWSFTVVQIDESRSVPDKRRILKVRVTQEGT